MIVTPPLYAGYNGVEFSNRLCGVSIIRSGESMENALRACAKGVKIGKILIQREGDTGPCRIIYEKVPLDIACRYVLLLDPILASGNSAIAAIDLLRAKGVAEDHIIFLTLIAAPQGIQRVCERYPHLVVVTSEVDASLSDAHVVLPGIGEFGDRYFGTDSPGDAIRPGERASASLPAYQASASAAAAAAAEARAAGGTPGQQRGEL